MATTMADGANGRLKHESKLRWIGDLDHPFYDDERQRFIWYEASTIAFQLFLFGNLALMGAMMWAGGGGSIPYAFALFVTTMMIVTAAQQYAKTRYAEYVPTKGELSSNRMKLYFATVIFMVTGLVRAVADVEEGGVLGFLFAGTEVHIGVGATIGMIAGAVGLAMKRRQLDQAEALDEF